MKSCVAVASLDPGRPEADGVAAATRSRAAGSVALPAGATARPLALTVEAVSLRIDGRAILTDVSLAVAPGETLAVVGPNGAGKSSLLKLMYGRLRPTRGRLHLDGRALDAVPLRERALRIAVVVQGDQPDLRLTVADYVGLGRIPHRGRVPDGAHVRAVGLALEQVGLDRVASRRLDALSGGERQRGAIARALAQQPGLLLLDEPTNHLDPRARADTLALARDLGVTAVAVLHDLALVAPFADRVAVLDGGRLVVHASPAAALTPDIVRSVFGMDCFSVLDPRSGRPVTVFDAPRPD